MAAAQENSQQYDGEEGLRRPRDCIGQSLSNACCETGPLPSRQLIEQTSSRKRQQHCRLTCDQLAVAAQPAQTHLDYARPRASGSQTAMIALATPAPSSTPSAVLAASTANEFATARTAAIPMTSTKRRQREAGARRSGGRQSLGLDKFKPPRPPTSQSTTTTTRSRPRTLPSPDPP